MSDQPTKELVLPASIPFADLKGKDLEECVYWLFDAMGAKDLEWRVGGSGGGAADGGRDLEARFYTPGADNEIEAQTWWIECKGRVGTVAPDEVKSTVLNAQARAGLDYIVIATNSQFSNPTRDWVKEWQASHPRPKVKLWDNTHLERLLSRQPDVVLRLFSEALSMQGRVQAMESRFWNKLEFVPPKTLAELWKAREQIEYTGLGLFAVIVNEFVNGNIHSRPWGAAIGSRALVEVLHLALLNTSYLMIRSYKGGVDERPIRRAFTYLILCALELIPAQDVARLIDETVYRNNGDVMPNNVKEVILMPIVYQLLSEMQDVCSSDCRRVSLLDRQALADGKDEIKDYWLRFEPQGVEEPAYRQTLRIESHDAPCNVGFPVDKDNGCPLFGIEPNINNVAELLAIIKRVATFRKAQATKKLQAEKKSV